MTLILIFLGWLAISSLWEFLSVIAPVRQFAAASLLCRKQAAIASGFSAFITGILFLYWISCYAMVAFFTYSLRCFDQPKTDRRAATNKKRYAIMKICSSFMSSNSTQVLSCN
jgi:hypothetical protein